MTQSLLPEQEEIILLLGFGYSAVQIQAQLGKDHVRRQIEKLRRRYRANSHAEILITVLRNKTFPLDRWQEEISIQAKRKLNDEEVAMVRNLAELPAQLHYSNPALAKRWRNIKEALGLPTQRSKLLVLVATYQLNYWQ